MQFNYISNKVSYSGSIFDVIRAKWIFTKPKKNKVLIYDSQSEQYSKYLFKKRDCEVLDVRYESFNIYVFLLALKSLKFSKVTENYKKIYIELVDPKIVYTAIDNNPAFYKLKEIIKGPTFITDQNGMSKVEDSYKQELFFGNLKNYKKITNKMPKVDHMFLFGENDKKKMSKLINGKIHLLGNTKNNHFVIRKRKVYKKINSIMFISSAYYERALIQDKILFKHLRRFCEKRKIKISLAGRQGKNHEKGEIFYRNYFGDGNWTFLPRISTSKTYNNLNNQQMIVFAHSTLGFQAIAKGIKCAVFYECFPEKGASGKFNKRGPFWTNSNNYQDFEKLLNKVMKYSNKKWLKISKQYSDKILCYKPYNIEKKKIINKILNDV